MNKTLLTALCALMLVPASAKKPIETLIVTGQNNHNWQLSSAVIERILEDSGLFAVDIAVSPAPGGDFSRFSPSFAAYDLVVLDYNGESWSAPTRAAFVDYVRRGGGVVIYHASDNSFAGWDEFNRITALGGWEGRDETSGPWLYVEDGRIVRDTSAGAGGSHGAQHEYTLDAFAGGRKHPIMKGLPSHWLHARDELYDRMRGPANVAALLYTAWSDPSTGGSGRHEPLIFTVDYGRGRIFHTMLGHAGTTAEDNPAMECVGFQTLLLRGCEWAATGRVRQRVPSDFPRSSGFCRANAE